MPTLTINGQDLTVDAGTNIIDAAESIGIEIPRYCYHPGLRVVASCRMCLVEVEGAPKLLPACATACADDMVVHTDSEKVVAAQEGVMELLLLHHPIDCPICDQAGECKLQDYSYEHGSGFSRQPLEAKIHRDKHKPIGPHVILDQERCVMCSRCVRFTDEVSKSGELAVINRGAHCAIDIFPGVELDNPYSGNVIDLCPVGALTSRDFRFKARVWYMKPTASVCPSCSKGCSIHIDHEADTIHRLRPRTNPHVNGYWMCDTGRFGFNYIHADSRLTQPTITEGGRTRTTGWSQAFDAAQSALAKVIDDHGADAVAVLTTTRLTNEDGLAMKRCAEEVLRTSRVGCIGMTAQDEAVDDLLMRTDANPNRIGLQYLEYQDAASVVTAVKNGDVKALYFAGEAQFLDADEVRTLAAAADTLECTIVQDISETPLSQAADIVLPALAYAETDGTYTNHAGWIQRFKKAINNAAGPRPGWEIAAHIARRFGEQFDYTSAFVVIRDVLARVPAYKDLSFDDIAPQNEEKGMAGNPGKESFGYLGRTVGTLEPKQW